VKKIISGIQKFYLKIPKFPLNGIFGIFSHDVGIDLGTANTLVWVYGKGIVIREPSVVSRHKRTKEVLAIGTSAKKMIGRVPQTIETIRPLKDGVIADFDAASAMLKYYIKKVHESGTVIPKIPKPRVVIGIPSGVTEVERRAVADAALASGAREAHLIEEPMAAALGAGLAVEEPEGIFIIDIGKSIRVAGDEMNEAVINYVRLKYSLLLGEPSAEEVKINIGTCVSLKKERQFVVRGRDLESGLPKSIKLTSTEIREALAETVQEIVRNIVNTIEETPPELIGDIMEKGIVMAGGGSLLTGIDSLISDASKMPVVVADDPMTCVVRGCGKILEDKSLLYKIRLVKGL